MIKIVLNWVLSAPFFIYKMVDITALLAEGGGQNKIASGCMLLTMKPMCQNTCLNEKDPS